MSGELSRLIYTMPPVTRVFVISRAITFFLFIFRFDLAALVFDPYLVIYKFQLWRLITPFFVCDITQKPMIIIINTYYFYLDLKYLELMKFKNNQVALLYYLLACICPLIMLQAFFLDLYYFLSFDSPLRFALEFTKSRFDPEVPVNVFLFLVIKNKYVPAFFALILQLNMGEEGLIRFFCGTFAAYVYLCLEHGDFGLITDYFYNGFYRSDSSFVNPPPFFSALIRVLGLLFLFKKVRGAPEKRGARSPKNPEFSSSASSSASSESYSGTKKLFRGQGRKLGT